MDFRTNHKTTGQQAVEKANSLKAMMRGPGWKVRVWENQGWHYEVRNGRYEFILPS